MTQYLIVFGDVQAFLEKARCKPSNGVKLIPLSDKINDTYGKVNEDPLKILVAQEEQTNIELRMFYPNLQAFKDACDKHPVPIMDLLTDDSDIGCITYKVVGIAGVLYCVEFDEEQINARDQVDYQRFPDNWVSVELPLLTDEGGIVMLKEGHVKEIELRVFDVRIFRWAKDEGIFTNDMDVGGNTRIDQYTLERLPHLNLYNTDVLNNEVLDHDTDARFTVYQKKGARP